MHLHVELELDFTRRRHWGSRDDELIVAHHSTRFQGCRDELIGDCAAGTRAAGRGDLRHAMADQIGREGREAIV